MAKYSISYKTWYGGHCYDSTGEAIWAKFFDDAGIAFTPHPGTFRTGIISNGEEIVYTPDFYFCDSGYFAEYKPADDFFDYGIQQKISGAMNRNFTPVGKGLLLLGPLNNFKKNDSKKLCLFGDFYMWFFENIVKSTWKIGAEDGVTKIFTEEPDWDDNSIYARYPKFAQSPSVAIGRSYSDYRASETIYRAVFNSIYAKENGLFQFFEDDSDSDDIVNDISFN